MGELQEQEWLLRGKPLRQVVRTGGAGVAALVAPDPRWFALHKLWLSNKPQRNPNKIKKNRAQGALLWQLASDGHFGQWPVDQAFLEGLPDELARLAA